MGKLVIVALAVALAGCIPYTHPYTEGEQVRLYFMNHIADEDFISQLDENCTYRGAVVGSEGHWYTYLFHTNTNMTYGALNDLRNNAAEMDANTVLVFKDITFVTSVTFVGTGYDCTNNRGRPFSR